MRILLLKNVTWVNKVTPKTGRHRLSLGCTPENAATHKYRRCVLKFCQIDKISKRTCIFDSALFCKLDKISIATATEMTA